MLKFDHFVADALELYEARSPKFFGHLAEGYSQPFRASKAIKAIMTEAKGWSKADAVMVELIDSPVLVRYTTQWLSDLEASYS